YSGKLDNGGEAIELVKPDAPQAAPHPDAGFVPYIRVDRVAYDDEAPWPSGADGNPNGIGISLQRRVPESYGNDPLNWLAASPTPGAANGASFVSLPAITQQPQNTGGMAGTNVSFSVFATGAAPLSYQWRFNGNNIPQATNSALTLNNVQTANAGAYSVVVMNMFTPVTSDNAYLVMTPPGITGQPQSRTNYTATTATFAVTASGDSPLSYQWRKNGSNLPNATNSSLVLANVQTGDAGNYSAVVFNPLGSATSAV